MNKRGFTLPEMLIAMFIALIIGMAGYSLFQNTSRTYTVQQDIVEEQQNLRMAMERISKDIRHAGFGLPDMSFLLTIGGQSFTAPFMVSNGTSTTSDSITVVGIGYDGSMLVTNVGSVVCSNGYGCNNSAANCLCLGNVDSLFDSSSHAFLPDRKYISIGGEAFQQLDTTGHDYANKMVRLAPPATLARTINSSDNTSVYIIQAIKYWIDSSGAVPVLMTQDYTGLRGSGAQTFAENIEDMQLAYGLDGSIPPNYKRDGKVDDKNGNGVFDEKDFRFSEAGDAAIADPTTIIAVRVSLVAKARNADNNSNITFQLPALEDRVAGAPDHYRRRVITNVVKVRNPKIAGH